MDPTFLIGDILERYNGPQKPVEFPSAAPASSSGFPQHKRRWKPSTFKQQRDGSAASAPASSPAVQSSESSSQSRRFEEIEKRRIDEENRRKIESMSPQEIAQAQDDLLNGLNSNLIQRLLRRANIDEPDLSSPFNVPVAEAPQLQPQSQPDSPPPCLPPPEIRTDDTLNTSTTRTSSSKSSRSKTSAKNITDNYDEDREPSSIPSDLFPIVDLPRSTHFPVPPGLADIDPSDPNFLSSLHQKYFPNLPADPSKLAWMAPIPSQDSVADRDSPYYPHPEISVSALRFDFRGRFLSPRISRSIPSSKGLHHHGEAPEAAGYTVAELARLARSAVPAQRCMAFQTLGRILYRLGRGEWGAGVDDPIAMGVWSSVKEGRVLETLMDASMGEGGHRGSRAYATEALWLFEKGGWREKMKGR